MNTPRSLLVATLFALSALATPAIAALFESPIARANREANARMWAAARDEHARQITKFNEQITAARAQFWATYPDKPGAAEAAARFADLLREKDIYFSNVVLSNGVSDFGGVGVLLDGQIRQSAGPEFEAWVNAVKLRIGTLLSNGADPLGWVARLQHGPEMAPTEYKRYSLERDWWEFDQVGRIPAQFDTPETYGAYLYYRFKFAALPKDDPRGERAEEMASATYARFVEVMGKQLVHDAARKIMAAPKTDYGRLVVTVARPVKLGPSGMVEQPVPVLEQLVERLTKPGRPVNTSVRRTSEVEDNTVPLPNEVIGVFANPLSALEILVTRDDDRRYLLLQLAAHHRLRSANVTGTKTDWDAAEILYRRLALAFGEKEMLEASRLVRMATKRLTDLAVMDPKAIGATRGTPLNSIEDILARKNPRGYLRAALIAREALDAPAAVDAAYQKLVSENGEAALLETARKRAAKPGNGGPNLTSASEIGTLMEWLRHPPVEAPVGPLADYPDYLEWKGFAAGAKVSYTERVWQRGRMGDQLVAGGPIYRYAYQLQSINDEGAKLWFTEINYGNYGQPRPGHDSELSYPAKFNLPLDGRTYESRASIERSLAPQSSEDIVWPSPARIESGAEIVEIAGRKVATRWQSVSHTYKPGSVDQGVKLMVKVWTSDAVPRGLVRRIEERVFPPQHYRYPLGARFVKETFVDTLEGNRAGVPPPDPTLPVAPAYAPNPAAAPPPPAPAVSLADFSSRIAPLTTRARQVRNDLGRVRGMPPPEIVAARERMDRLFDEAAMARGRGANDVDLKLKELDATIAVLEKFLKLR